MDLYILQTRKEFFAQYKFRGSQYKAWKIAGEKPRFIGYQLKQDSCKPPDILGA